MTSISRDDFVTYTVRQTGVVVRARVLRIHRDGTATVQAHCTLRDGKPADHFLGYKYRMSMRDLSPSQ